ncbi:hypothetical protein KC480_05660 [Bacillus velezensis]|uniref:hypothetical protein n=1 Tax=Bacillus velezensis TaxID=492670 RepID=UPI001E421620|nr:hypothetical protein [Bacillus velezensis]MCD7911010.1 hypothetical protein [Bacillus velezensis]
MIYAYLFLIVLLLNFVYNYYKYKQCEKFISWYEKWLIDPDFNVNLLEYKSSVVSLVERAGFGDVLIPYTEEAGYGRIRTGQVSPIKQFPSRAQDIATGILIQLSSSKGTYRKRMLISVNPLAWLEILIYLPSFLLNYIGIKKNSMLSKLFNVLWWIFGVVLIPIFIAAYTPEISSFIRDIFK